MSQLEQLDWDAIDRETEGLSNFDSEAVIEQHLKTLLGIESDEHVQHFDERIAKALGMSQSDYEQWLIEAALDLHGNR